MTKLELILEQLEELGYPEESGSTYAKALEIMASKIKSGEMENSEVGKYMVVENYDM